MNPGSARDAPVAPATWPLMARDAPAGVVHLHRAETELDLEAGGRARVERDHAVVGVPTETGGDRGSGALRPLESEADGVKARRLDHEMVQAPGRGQRDEREAVVPRVAVEEL